MISLDKQALEADSAAQRRLSALGEAVGELTVLVPGTRTETLRLSEHLTVISVGGFKFTQLLGLWGKGAQELQRTPYDLITVQDPYFLGFLACKLSEKSEVPLEVQIHGTEKLSGLRERVAAYVLSRAKKIRVVSSRLRRFLHARFMIEDSRIYELPVYTQIAASERFLPRKTVPYPFTFLTVGRLVPVKNIPMQLRAFARLAALVPHVRLRIVGEGPERQNLQQTTDNLQLKNNVSFEGYQKDLKRYYEEADAFLLTSDSEGWGRVLLEAAAHGLPIIMTNVGLANEALHHDRECIVIPAGDEEQLYLAMKELLERPELRARLGEAAFKAFKMLPSAEEQIHRQVEEWRSIQKLRR